MVKLNMQKIVSDAVNDAAKEAVKQQTSSRKRVRIRLGRGRSSYIVTR